MNIKSTMYALLSGAVIVAAGTFDTQASTLVTFSVDMSTNVANGTFTNGVSTVTVLGSFNGWGTGVVLNQEPEPVA